MLQRLQTVEHSTFENRHSNFGILKVRHPTFPRCLFRFLEGGEEVKNIPKWEG